MALALAGCGGSFAANPVDAGGGLNREENGDSSIAAAVIPPGWTVLVLGAWSLEAGSTGYRCRRVLVGEDIWVSRFRVLAPTGTHHAIASLSEVAAPLGDFDCSTGNLDPKILYAAGATTPDLELPAGVSVHLEKGQAIDLNLHVIDALNDPLSGNSGVLVQVLPEAEVRSEARIVLAGPTSFTVPANTASYTVAGDQAVTADLQLFGLWPHMHRRGSYSKVMWTHAGATTTLYDSLYTFDEQRTYAAPATTLHAGDQLHVECTYINLTAIPAPFGAGAGDEMCYLGLAGY